MPRHLHYDGERFAYWSTVVDAYVTYSLTKEEVAEEAASEWGQSFVRHDFEPHFQRAIEHGCSAVPPFRCDKDEIEPFPPAHLHQEAPHR